ncbi:hypothetical protein LU674_000330 [Pseudomonas alloputida]|jgi:hypothetical protein|uniref:Uncharacterized protein n=2 Tax=Pseudomonas TaxID=286 RepID=A0A109LB48_PSEFL|nr:MULTISPECIES: hypothetical protein [Pseudomonas]KWV84437.1 hypothetical protein PFLmoz3_05929 [Pseudomonas fluorescens]MBN0552469.1 hypothetical protein [Pseudomonas aeruginosa]MCE0975683.1 hypothetical protein [Pseudomonas putida]MDM3950796.1 hypothetical protein [Pseudomonas alloputida]
MTSINGLGLNVPVGYHSKHARIDESPAQSDANQVGKAQALVAAEQQEKSATDKFMEYMNMSDQEKLQYMLLAQMGISKEEYDSMSPEEKASIDEKIEERMKQISEAQNKQGSQGAERSSTEGKLNAAIENSQARERKPVLDLSA